MLEKYSKLPWLSWRQCGPHQAVFWELQPTHYSWQWDAQNNLFWKPQSKSGSRDDPGTTGLASEEKTGSKKTGRTCHGCRELTGKGLIREPLSRPGLDDLCRHVGKGHRMTNFLSLWWSQQLEVWEVFRPTGRGKLLRAQPTFYCAVFGGPVPRIWK